MTLWGCINVLQAIDELDAVFRLEQLADDWDFAAQVTASSNNPEWKV